MTTDTNTAKKTAEKQPTGKKHQRLPCRGCMPDCINRSSCDGKPWRIMPAASASES